MKRDSQFLCVNNAKKTAIKPKTLRHCSNFLKNQHDFWKRLFSNGTNWLLDVVCQWHYQQEKALGQSSEMPEAKDIESTNLDLIDSISLCYIGETGRKFNTRLEEHKSEANKVSGSVTTRAGRKESLTTTHKSAITDHVVDKNHVIGWGEAKIIGTEQDRYKRWIKEAIAIRKKGGTTMNRDEGQYFLSHVFDEILMKKTHPIGRSTGNTESGNTVARRQSTSVSSQWWLRQQLIAETYTVSCFTWIRIWETFVYHIILTILMNLFNNISAQIMFLILISSSCAYILPNTVLPDIVS